MTSQARSCICERSFICTKLLKSGASDESIAEHLLTIATDRMELAGPTIAHMRPDLSAPRHYSAIRLSGINWPFHSLGRGGRGRTAQTCAMGQQRLTVERIMEVAEVKAFSIVRTADLDSKE